MKGVLISMEKIAETFVILEVQHDGGRPLVWVVGFGGVAQLFSKIELERELKSFRDSRPNSKFEAVPVNV